MCAFSLSVPAFPESESASLKQANAESYSLTERTIPLTFIDLAKNSSEPISPDSFTAVFAYLSARLLSLKSRIEDKESNFITESRKMATVFCPGSDFFLLEHVVRKEKIKKSAKKTRILFIDPMGHITGKLHV